MSRLFTHHDRLYLFQSSYFNNSANPSSPAEPEEDENGVEKVVQPSKKAGHAGGFSVFVPHFHKMFGLLAIINMLLYITPMYTTILDDNVVGKNRLIKLSFVHLILALSSFEFRIGRSRNGIYTIYREMQLHTIIFTFRSWTVMMCDYVLGVENIMLRMPLVLFWHVLADVATALYKPAKGGTTIRRSEDGKTSGYQEYGRAAHLGLWFFSFSQLVGTFMLLTDSNDMARNSMFVMTPVQISAFLATLVRKGYFSSQTSVTVYFLILWPIFFYHHWTLLDLGCVIAAQVLRFNFRLNKYVMWIGLATLVAYVKGDLHTFMVQYVGAPDAPAAAAFEALGEFGQKAAAAIYGLGDSHLQPSAELAALLTNGTWQPGTGIGEGFSKLMS